MQSDMIEITIAPLDGRSLRSCKRIAAEAFDENSHENQAVQAFSTTNQSGFAARVKGKIVGFALCSGRNPVKILAFAVEKKQRRNGIGRMLLDRIVRLSRQKVIVTVDDRALDAHLLGLVPK